MPLWRDNSARATIEFQLGGVLRAAGCYTPSMEHFGNAAFSFFAPSGVIFVV